MKNILIVSAVGIAAYGLYLKMKGKKKPASKTTSFSVKSTKERHIVPDSMLENFEINKKKIFAGGIYHNIPWPSDTPQSYVHS